MRKSEAKELFHNVFPIGHENTWLGNWQEWFVRKPGTNRYGIVRDHYEVKNFNDGSNIWSVVSQELRDIYKMEKPICGLPNCGIPSVGSNKLEYTYCGHASATCAPQKKEEKEQDMYACQTVSTTESPDTRTFHHLQDRAREVRSEKIRNLRAAFFLDGTPKPTTIGELKDYLSKGFLVFDDAATKGLSDDFAIYGWRDYVTWQDPSKKPDRAGFDAAEKIVLADYKALKDTLYVKSSDDALTALQAFEAKTYT